MDQTKQASSWKFSPINKTPDEKSPSPALISKKTSRKPSRDGTIPSTFAYVVAGNNLDDYISKLDEQLKQKKMAKEVTKKDSSWLKQPTSETINQPVVQLGKNYSIKGARAPFTNEKGEFKLDRPQLNEI